MTNFSNIQPTIGTAFQGHKTVKDLVEAKETVRNQADQPKKYTMVKTNRQERSDKMYGYEIIRRSMLFKERGFYVDKVVEDGVEIEVVKSRLNRIIKTKHNKKWLAITGKEVVTEIKDGVETHRSKDIFVLQSDFIEWWNRQIPPTQTDTKDTVEQETKNESEIAPTKIHYTAEQVKAYRQQLEAEKQDDLDFDLNLDLDSEPITDTNSDKITEPIVDNIADTNSDNICNSCGQIVIVKSRPHTMRGLKYTEYFRKAKPFKSQTTV